MSGYCQSAENQEVFAPNRALKYAVKAHITWHWSISVRRAIVVLLMAGALAGTMAGTASAQGTKSAPPTTPPKREEPIATAVVAPQVIPGLTSFADAVVRMGALACASRVNQVSGFLAGDPKSYSVGFVFPVPQPADRRLLSLSIGIDMPEIPPSYIGASFAPNQAAGCEASYEAVTYWPKACAQVAAKQYPASQPGPDLGSLKMLVIGSRARVFLLPAGAGCVSIKKELVGE